MMKRRYLPKTIRKACVLYNSGEHTIRGIMKATGIRNHNVIYFHCDPKKRAEIIKKQMEWRKKNPKKWQKMNLKAVRKYQKSHA